jgi:hypothetical protein
MCAFNAWRVNVVSAESGIDHPRLGVFKATELDCRFGNINEPDRCITSDSPAKCYEAAAYCPGYDAICVLVNDSMSGGCATGEFVFSSISVDFIAILPHELGHRIGALADEYSCYLCEPGEVTQPYTGPEPPAPNVTSQTKRKNIKWKDLIASRTHLPTTQDNPPGVVGLWTGAWYRQTGIYRPQSLCMMRMLGWPFCAVCDRELDSQLAGYCTDSVVPVTGIGGSETP